jgi:hypothetical protein
MYGSIEQINGLTILEVSGGWDDIRFKCTNGDEFVMEHRQSCCESVSIEDITEGWKEILTGATVVNAYESTNSNDPPPNSGYTPESYTWTFYRINTDKGTVVVRWYGTSNGYYSETAGFYKLGESYW